MVVTGLLMEMLNDISQVVKRSRKYDGEVAGVKGLRGFRYVSYRIHVVILSVVVLRRLACP